MMKIGIASIQRDRNPWIVEWLAFHMLAGFNEFHVYSHKCRDGMTDTLLRLARHYPVHVYAIEHDDKPQLAAYEHAWRHHGPHLDWLAFIDGDEFLFPVRSESMAEALLPYQNQPISALGVYWICYGSNGHLEDPGGLLMEQFPRHSAPDFPPNRHMKSIVRGGEGINLAVTGSHLFGTPRGTVDEYLRPVTEPVLRDINRLPTWDVFRINHYATQSYEFFRTTKQRMGTADCNPQYVRPDTWFTEYDRNECDDGTSYRFLIRLKLKVRELEQALMA